ncbi:MAG TPA: matrixin family metalloprotease [Isosphaeraceae bacterium]|jgi:hypothetical protein|nr:matrixin family metalloprotease [Isosphaeraceae bacterium]
MLLYATSGGQWAFPARVTYSFMPDGTSIGGTPSILFQKMNAKFTTAAWEQQIEKGASVWEAVANINLALVSDDGTAIGANGNQQDDPRFGDIRIGGMSQGSTQLAFTYAAPPFNGGTLAGDMFFNTDQSWQINGTTYDLLTVAIHEMGHALGMSHSADSTAVMYATYSDAKQTITTDDTSGIQSIYGAPKDDVFDLAHSNDTYSTASVLTPYINGQNQVTVQGLELTTSSPTDWYYVTAPTGTATTMTATVQSKNLSSMSPAVWVYDSSLHFLGKTTAPFSYGGTASFTASGVTAGHGYYIKAVGADLGPAGVGGYGLEVNFSTTAMSPIAPPNTVVTRQSDQGGGGSADGTGGGSGGNDNGGNGDHNHHHDNNNGDFQLMTVGTVSGFGDALTISDPAPSSSMTAAAGSALLGANLIVPFAPTSAVNPFDTGDPFTVISNPKTQPTAQVAALYQALSNWRLQKLA